MSKVISTHIHVPIHIGEKQRPREGVGLTVMFSGGIRAKPVIPSLAPSG